MGSAAGRRLDHLVTRDVVVDGRAASYADGGRGLPVLFLHGWGLDHHVYQRSLRRLTARGCRVIAPSMPGFGATEDLPPQRTTLSGFASWVAQFLEAVGIAEPVVVLGHSFGGGVATQFAHDHPGAVRYLVLLNSVGGPRFGGQRRRGIQSVRPAVVKPADVLRPSAAWIATTAMQQRVFAENVARHPLSIMKTARLALFADLTTEMATLAERNLPVLVLWSDNDELVPLSAFDTFCTTFGTDGHVVRGGHSWLLADPDVFGEVLDNVIHLQSTEHEMRSATASAEQLRSLLHRTTVPGRVATRLVADASPLWILSESPAVLAADLALCHPRLGPGEVRAVAREMPSANTFRLTVVAGDRPGLLADTAAALADEGVSIVTASATTWPHQRLALHAVTVRSDSAFDDERWAVIGNRLRAMERAPSKSFRFVPSGRARVTQTGEGDDRSIVRVTAVDQLGLLSATCRWFADHGLTIEAAAIDTVEGEAKDVFLVRGHCDVTGLARHLSGDDVRTFPAVCASMLNALLACRRR